MTVWAVSIVVAWLAGTVPFGLLIARAKGLDIRREGSGNIGATNVGRVLGARYFVLCFTLDVLKGLVPVLAAGVAAGTAGRVDLTAFEAWMWLAVVCAPVLGHMFTPWAGFRGGKGVATGLGALLGVFPILAVPGLLALGVFGLVLALWRYVSLASCAAAVSLPIWVWHFFGLYNVQSGRRAVEEAGGPDLPQGATVVYEHADPWPFVIATVLLGVLVLVRHRSNLGRIARGEEPKVGAKRGQGP